MAKFDVETAVLALGILIETHGHEATALCPVHEERTGKADHSPSWWINLESGMHTCFSCGYKGNLVQLVCDIKGFRTEVYGVELGYDYAAGEAWLASVAEVPIEVLLEAIKSLPSYQYPKPSALQMSEARLVLFTDPPQEALLSRNITEDSAKAYGVMWDEKTKNWILPLREPHFNKLMGWQEKGTVERTFKNRPTGLQKSKTLFGVDVQNDDLAIVVESPLDCLRIHSAGFPGAVAICGSSPSDDQIKLLRSSDRVIVALDNPNLDKSGFKGSKEFSEFARKYGINLSFFNYGNSSKKDPGDMTDDEIAWGIAHAKPSILGELAYVSGDTKALSD